MRQSCGNKAVVTLFASSSSGERMSLELYASTHREIKLIAALSTGCELLELLRAGIQPQVIVLDMPLDDLDPWRLLSGIKEHSPDAQILLSVRTQEEKTLQQLCLTFRQSRVILKPWKLSRLFEVIYTMGTDERQGHAYEIYNRCARVLDRLQGDCGLTGHAYAREMAVHCVMSEQDMNLAELKRFVSLNHNTGEPAVTSALNRLNEEMFHRHTPLYQRFCVQNGLDATARLSLGKLIKSIAGEVRYEQGD